MSITVVSGAVGTQAWRDLIARRCGLVFRDAQVPVVLAAVRDHARARGAGEPEYFARLSDEADGGAEWSALVERLLNHETSFFRHPQSFELLRERVLPELREAARGRRLNLWSAGCSTGQEAYSLAMVAIATTNHDERRNFSVWGGDISRDAITLARLGRYGRRAVAAVPAEYRERFFQPVGDDGADEYEIVDEVRRRVRFSTINLLAACDMSLSHDVIFCHNVLIYFGADAASRVVAGLAQRLAPGGYLFLGPGEGPSERPAGLEPVAMTGVRAFRRRTPGNGDRRP